MKEQMNEQTNHCTNEQMKDGWMGRRDEWNIGWMEQRMDGWVCIWVDGRMG